MRLAAHEDYSSSAVGGVPRFTLAATSFIIRTEPRATYRREPNGLSRSETRADWKNLLVHDLRSRSYVHVGFDFGQTETASHGIICVEECRH